MQVTVLLKNGVLKVLASKQKIQSQPASYSVKLNDTEVFTVWSVSGLNSSSVQSAVRKLASGVSLKLKESASKDVTFFFFLVIEVAFCKANQ